MKQKGFAPIIIIVLIALVAAGAYVLGTKNILKLPTFPLTPTLSPSSTTNPTANWKTYTSRDGSFSFKYPENLYTLNSNEQNLIFYDSSVRNPAFTDQVLNIGVSPYDKSKYQNSGSAISPFDFTDTQGRTWKTDMVLGESSYNFSATLLTADKMYIVGIQSGLIKGDEIKFGENHRNLANQILSTFKFLPDTSNWRTYIDPFYNYTIKYPRELSVEPTPSKNSGVAQFRGKVNGENKYLVIGIGGVDTTRLGPGIKIIEEKDKEIGNIEMHRQILSPSRQTNFAILYTFTTGKIWYFAEWFSNNYQAEAEYYEQILSTFKFTE